VFSGPRMASRSFLAFPSLEGRTPRNPFPYRESVLTFHQTKLKSENSIERQTQIQHVGFFLLKKKKKIFFQLYCFPGNAIFFVMKFKNKELSRLP
jgi:hypothetical protein